jgi:hypothetical protein
MSGQSSVLPVVAFLMGVSPCGGGGGTPGPVEAPPVVVGVAVDAPIAETGDRFLSFTVDTDRLRLRASGSAGIDFEAPRLRRLVQELSPAVMRIGGSVADTIYYDLDDALTTPPAPYLQILRGSTWDAACELALDLDLQIAFTLNAGDGTRDAEGRWTSDAARAFIERSRAMDCPVTVWELGNEVSSWWAELDIDFTPTPEEYAADFLVARALLDELDPDAKLAGPASAYWPRYGEVGSPETFLPDFLGEAGPLVDVVTWHYYPTQSERCPVPPSIPAREETLLDPATFDEMLVWAAVVEGARDASAPQAEVWLGETANAQCGGQEGLSDRFVAGLWWLDELGLLAKRGQRVVARQSLDGGRYHLIDAETLEPYPDYFNSILWRRLMGPAVLEARVLSFPATEPDAGAGLDPARVRLYAHCTPGRTGAVTVLALNLHEAAAVPLSFLGAGAARELYLLTADDRLGTDVELNGTVLAVAEDGSPPAIAPVAATDPIELPATSYAFVVLPDADAPACR